MAGGKCREACSEKHCWSLNGFAALCSDEYWHCLAKCGDSKAQAAVLLKLVGVEGGGEAGG